MLDAANGWFVWALPALAAVFALLPASVGVAILRHHLYDIDRLLSRTLTYGLLTVVLGLVYAGAVVVLARRSILAAGTPAWPWPPPRCS